MRLTKKRAIDLSIELWTDLAETGKRKEDWPRWNEFDYVQSHCFLCEYGFQRRKIRWRMSCDRCPYFNEFGRCDKNGTLYDKWTIAFDDQTRKLHAAAFLKQLKELRKP